MLIDQLLKMLWATDEGKAAAKAIRWCNKNFPDLPEEKRMEFADKFEKQYDEPLNKKWQQILKLYKVKKEEIDAGF